MQISSAEILLAGEINNTVIRKDVTPAEVALLQFIHGAESVINIRPRKNDKRTHDGEIDRLKSRYGEKVFGEVFSGFTPKLPVYLKDIGLAGHFYAPDVSIPKEPKVDMDTKPSADETYTG